MKSMFKMFVVMSRTFDMFHTKSGLTHLVASIFYSEKDINIEDLQSKDLFLSVIWIVQDSNLNVSKVKFPKVTDKIGVYKIPSALFLKSHSNIIKNIFGGHKISEKEYSKNFVNGRNKFLFIFDEIDWYQLKLILDNGNVRLSGGSSSLRQVLSSVEYMLALFLLRLDFELDEIYQSSQILKKYKDSNRNTLSKDMDYSLLSFIIKDSFKEEIEKIGKEIEGLKTRIVAYQDEYSIKEGIMSSFEAKDNDKSIKKHNKVKVKQELRIQNRVKNLLSILKDKENEVLILENKKKLIVQEIKSIENQKYTFSQLSSIYETNFAHRKEHTYISDILSNINNRFLTYMDNCDSKKKYHLYNDNK